MGAEVECVARHGGRKASGKALLETTEIVFRSPELKLKIPFAAIRDVTADAESLRVRTDEGETIFELGAKSAKWLDKILHPPTRMDKAGVKAGMRVSLVGIEDASLGPEIDATGAMIVTRDPDLTFLGIDEPKQLARIKRVKAPAVWIVSPRGKPDIIDTVVMTAAKKEGWVDVKVMRFNDTHTALKFVRRKEN